MLSISIGPLALPVAPLLLGVSIWFGSWLAGRVAARVAGRGTDPAVLRAAGNAMVNGALLGLLAARMAHLAQHASLYAATPMAVFDLRDGGWNSMAGVGAGGAFLLWQAWRGPALRRGLAAGSLGALVLWLAGALSLGVYERPAMPALLLTEFDTGRPVSLSQAARGRPVVVNLWASWCGPCRQEMPMLAAAQAREGQVGFLFVNQGETAATVRAYLSGPDLGGQGLTLAGLLLDPHSALGPAVGSRGLPTTLFYDARGRLVDAHFGVLNAAALEARLRSLRPPS